MGLRKKLLVVLFMLLAAAGVLGVSYLYIEYRSEKDSKFIQRVQQTLSLAAAGYQNRTVSLTIDGQNHSYTMEQLGEHIYYQYDENTTYELGEEASLAELIFNGKHTVTEDELSGMVQCAADEEAVQTVMKKLSDTYNTPPKNSRIDSSGAITPSELGHTLDTATIHTELMTYLNQETTDHYSASYRTSTTEPEWTTEKVEKVTHVISSYSTSFGATTPRGTNIRIAASRLDNTFLLPGESISFLDILYDDSDGKSYKKSGAYFKGKVVQAEGGGICQVSTTAYDAFLIAGIIPVKRYPHSMPVSYSPLGLDSALSVGGKDLQIKNTLDVPILVLAKTKGGRLNVHIKSYKNALKGYRYKPRAEQLSAKKAKSYLDVYKNGKKKKTIFLSKDTYD
ncbi:MAG: VanW family protein [Lachnospiraceae bacterium]|nr:VanW family protein [Lachnospiraceae bacterium]